MAANIEVYDNFLSQQNFLNLQKVLLGKDFPWFMTPVISNTGTKISQDYNFQFSHVVYRDFTPQSNAMDLVNPIIQQLDPLAILRIKANLTTRTDQVIEHGYHTDYPKEVECLTGVFYVNTTDGYTKFLTGEFVTGLENRLVLFDSRLQHTGTTCTNSNVRCVINFNLIPRPQPIGAPHENKTHLPNA